MTAFQQRPLLLGQLLLPFEKPPPKPMGYGVWPTQMYKAILPRCRQMLPTVSAAIEIIKALTWPISSSKGFPLSIRGPTSQHKNSFGSKTDQPLLGFAKLPSKLWRKRQVPHSACFVVRVLMIVYGATSHSDMTLA